MNTNTGITLDRFVEDLGITPTKKQKYLFWMVSSGETNISIVGEQNEGRTWGTAVVALWRLLKNPASPVIVVTPTMRQSECIWLQAAKEISRKSSYPFQPYSKGIYFGDYTKAAGYPGIVLLPGNRIENFKRFKQPEITVIIDEVQGVDGRIVSQILNLKYALTITSQRWRD